MAHFVYAVFEGWQRMHVRNARRFQGEPLHYHPLDYLLYGIESVLLTGWFATLCCTFQASEPLSTWSVSSAIVLPYWIATRFTTKTATQCLMPSLLAGMVIWWWCEWQWAHAMTVHGMLVLALFSWALIEWVAAIVLLMRMDTLRQRAFGDALAAHKKECATCPEPMCKEGIGAFKIVRADLRNTFAPMVARHFCVFRLCRNELRCFFCEYCLGLASLDDDDKDDDE